MPEDRAVGSARRGLWKHFATMAAGMALGLGIAVVANPTELFEEDDRERTSGPTVRDTGTDRGAGEIAPAGQGESFGMGPSHPPSAPWAARGTPTADDPRVQAVREQVADDLAAHRAEPLDPEWGPGSTEKLRADLGEVSIAPLIEVVDVDCRSKTCLATVQWPDYTSAFRTYRRLLTHHYAVNCRRRMGVAPPDDPTEPYQAHLLIDCTDRREETSGG